MCVCSLLMVMLQDCSVRTPLCNLVCLVQLLWNKLICREAGKASADKCSLKILHTVAYHSSSRWSLIPSKTALVTFAFVSLSLHVTPVSDHPTHERVNNSLAAHHPRSLPCTCCNSCPAARFTVYASLWIMIDQMVETSHSACAVAVAVTVVPMTSLSSPLRSPQTQRPAC